MWWIDTENDWHRFPTAPVPVPLLHCLPSLSLSVCHIFSMLRWCSAGSTPNIRSHFVYGSGIVHSPLIYVKTSQLRRQRQRHWSYQTRLALSLSLSNGEYDLVCEWVRVNERLRWLSQTVNPHIKNRFLKDIILCIQKNYAHTAHT